MPPVSRSARERNCRRVLIVGDNLIAAGAFIVAPFLTPSSDFPLTLQADPVVAVGSMAVVIVSLLTVLALSRLNSGYSWFERIQQISLSLGAVFLLEALLSYVHFAWLLELYDAFMGSVLCGASLLIWYLIFRIVFPGFPAKRRVLLVGSDVAFPEIEAALAAGEGSYQLVGPLPFPDDLRARANELEADEIVAGEAAAGGFPAKSLLDLRFQGVAIQNAAAFFESTLQRVSCRHLQPVRFLYGEISPKRQKLALQAIYSNVLGLAALAIAAPLMIAAAIALKISAPREPLLEDYQAIGLHGVPFDRLRFHSRSKLGLWLARIRIRGLPQLFNVVRGEMSLVGPRPIRVEFGDPLSRQIPYYSQRVAVRPGLTGWAQIHRTDNDNRFDASVELEYDLYYIKNLSPSFDLDVLLATLLGGVSG